MISGEETVSLQVMAGLVGSPCTISLSSSKAVMCSRLEHLPMLEGKTDFLWGSNTSPQDITLEGR